MAIDKNFFINNREKFIGRLPEATVVVLFSGSSMPMCQDTDYRFLPDRNFYYLTGLDKENYRIIIVKNVSGSRVTLFVPPRDNMVERWHGKRLSKEQISEISGVAIEDILDEGEFDECLFNLERSGMKLASDASSIMSDTKKFMSSGKTIEDVSNILTSIRMIKEQDEADAIREAAKITEAALLEMKEHIRPGVTEVELYTALEYGMAKRGCLIPAFTTITAIGSNSFYLHHGDPEDETGVTAKPGDSIQIDVGARYKGYCADISRTYFVGGASETMSESDDKRYILHELITKLRRRCWEFIKPGETFKTLNEAMYAIVGPWLLEHGLIDEVNTDNIKKYYWHNTSHHLGLDVHDVSDREKPFSIGNALAVEPGVYIPEWNVGFRIEDDVYVTADGCVLLSSGDDDIEGIVV